MNLIATLPAEFAGKRVLPTSAAAQFVGLSKREFERKRAAGLLPRAIRIGKRKLGYQVEDLAALLEESREPE